MKAWSLVKVFQIILVVLVALFTMVGLTLLLSEVESTLLANAGTTSFTFAVSARTFRIVLVTLLFLSAVCAYLAQQTTSTLIGSRPGETASVHYKTLLFAQLHFNTWPLFARL